MNEHYYTVIMAGGVGSRFWPMSRKKRPKQFLDILNNGKTLFQATYERFLKICKKENIFIVANEDYREIIKQQIPDIDDRCILGEPYGRNTAPCIAYAAHKIYKIDKDAVMVAAPSDHLINNEKEFQSTILKSLKFTSENDDMITLGIKPANPATGYGYIQFNEDNSKDQFYKVKTFTEKPNEDLARHFLETGEFLWNAGIFVWNVNTVIKAFEKFLPEINEIFAKGKKFFCTDEEVTYIQKAYELCTNISIDYGIMEKADNVYVIPAEFGWSDIGTWKALFELIEKDKSNNIIKGDKVISRNTTNCIINVPNDKVVSLNHVNNLIIVETDGILLIADIEKEQEIRQLVNEVKIKWGEKYI